MHKRATIVLLRNLVVLNLCFMTIAGFFYPSPAMVHAVTASSTPSASASKDSGKAPLKYYSDTEGQNFTLNTDNPNAVTISIGNDDVVFRNMLEKCIVPFNGASSFSQNCYQTYEDRLELVNQINNQFNNLVNTYKTVKDGNLDRRVYVIGYPQIVSATGSCGVNVRLSQSDRQFAVQLVDYLDSVVQKAAAKAGVYYVDTQQAFDGHKLCEDGALAVNGLTEGDDTFVRIANESYHPNQLGQQLLADTVAAKTHNLTNLMPAADPSIQNPKADSTLAILQAPKVGRVTYEVLNAADTYQQVTGGLVNISISKYAQYVQPGSTMQAELHSTPLNLGTVTVSADGKIQANLTLPGGIAPGFHTLHLYGKNIAGDPIDIQQVLYVSASPNDYDGDGVENAVDACKLLPNSGQDTDADGVDEACDVVINPVAPPSSSLEPETSPTAPDQTGGGVGGDWQPTDEPINGEASMEGSAEEDNDMVLLEEDAPDSSDVPVVEGQQIPNDAQTTEPRETAEPQNATSAASALLGAAAPQPVLDVAAAKDRLATDRWYLIASGLILSLGIIVRIFNTQAPKSK